ncbi:MAG: hypothetical protein JNK60_07775, partial [Acidobacteria bacterium]|nr:hypothetical protein [Acidobacteriota bacterium]
VDDGFLPAHPRPGACTYCDFKDVCGPNEEERVARKKADPAIDALRELRSLP